MTTLNPTGIDGTAVTVTLTGEHAQSAAAAIGYMAGTELQHLGEQEPWNSLDRVTVAMLERHVAEMQAVVDRYRTVMLQFEAQDVIDLWTANRAAWNQECERLGVERLPVGVPLPEAAPPTTGDVSLTWTLADFELLVAELTNADAQEHQPEWVRAGEAIREQLAAR